MSGEKHTDMRPIVSADELQLLMRLQENQQRNVHDVVESDQEMWKRGFALSDRGLLAMVSHPKGGTFHITRLGVMAISATLEANNG